MMYSARGVEKWVVICMYEERSSKRLHVLLYVPPYVEYVRIHSQSVYIYGVPLYPEQISPSSARSLSLRES